MTVAVQDSPSSKSGNMHIVLVSNPATGQMNPLLAVSQHLLARGHHVYFLTGSSFAKRFNQFRSRLSEEEAARVAFVDLGTSNVVEDYTPAIQAELNGLRTSPGSIGFIHLWDRLVGGTEEIFKATAYNVRDQIDTIDPDMVVADNFSAALLDGVRLSGRAWIHSCPAAPTMIANPDPFREPFPILGVWHGSWGDVFRNFVLIAKFSHWSWYSNSAQVHRQLRYNEYGFPKLGLLADAFPSPPMSAIKECVAGISYNVSGLHHYQRREAFADKQFFVGATLPMSRKPTSVSFDELEKDAEISWLDDALANGEDVVYMNMGSIFVYSRKEYEAVVEAFSRVHKARGHLRVLLKIPDQGTMQDLPPASALPSFIRRVEWVPSVEDVLSHAAVKVSINHAGGNSFNEAVYYAMPQLSLSQWTDTHDLAAIVQSFGLGLRSDKSPFLDADDISSKLLRLLGDEWPQFKSNSVMWSLRSRQGGGAVAAADIIETYARRYGRGTKSG